MDGPSAPRTDGETAGPAGVLGHDGGVRTRPRELWRTDVRALVNHWPPDCGV
ncbi:hypothetical protein ACH4GP_14105 [Streptomyces celluloflavus]|uniref:Uncharacterized protein n=1 Tax=Streptomyces celluloflavus TaxID=58344 RepID=A0ABW7RDT8_9ACTN